MKVLNAKAAHLALRPRMSTIVEEFWALALSVDKTLLGTGMIHRGSLVACPISPRQLFRFGFLQNAHALIIAHSHTGESALPSKRDVMTTQSLIELGKRIEMEIIDHIILAPTEYYSFANKNRFDWEDVYRGII